MASGSRNVLPKLKTKLETLSPAHDIGGRNILMAGCQLRPRRRNASPRKKAPALIRGFVVATIDTNRVTGSDWPAALSVRQEPGLPVRRPLPVRDSFASAQTDRWWPQAAW